MKKKIANKKLNHLNTIIDIKENNNISDNNANNNIKDDCNKLLVVNLNSIEELKNVKSLSDEELASWWTLVIADKSVPMKERLAASDKLAKYLGMYEKSKTIATSGGAVYKWRSTTIDAEIVHDTNTTSDVSDLKN